MAGQKSRGVAGGPFSTHYHGGSVLQEKNPCVQLFFRKKWLCSGLLLYASPSTVTTLLPHSLECIPSRRHGVAGWGCTLCYGSPHRGDPSCLEQAHVPLKPPPPRSRPLPFNNQPRTRKQTKAVKHRGSLTAHFWRAILFELNRCCLVAGCLRRQVSHACPPGGRGGHLGTQGVQESRVGCKNKKL